MANVESNTGDPTQAEQKQTWAPMKLTVLGIVTLGLALTIIVFMATRLTTCMYLDGSH